MKILTSPYINIIHCPDEDVNIFQKTIGQQHLLSKFTIILKQNTDEIYSKMTIFK